ncbi:MAG: DEAD/DEAH box helicase, partial [Trebonia sp.]
MFARTVFTSATLTTSGSWDYLIDRLGVGGCDRITLPGPFDYATQALLVCFSDFPSWAEHTETATRSVAHQLVGYGREAIVAGRQPGAMVLTTATATMAGIGEHLAAYSAAAGLNIPMAVSQLYGNRRSVEMYRQSGGWLVGTKGLWAGVDVPEADRTRIVWINKLPFAPFAEPLIAARRADVSARAEREGHPDPEAAATERYYLPLAAIELRQAAGRLIRSDRHRGVIVISDRKLSGSTSTRRLYRRVMLESLDEGLHRPDPHTGEATGGNVMSMVDGWRQMWEFLASGGDIDPGRLGALCSDDALDAQTLLAQTRAIRDAALSLEDIQALTAAGTLEDEVVSRAEAVAGLLRFEAAPLRLKDEQKQVIAAAARGDDLLALLPTGFGKSYCFQLPALILPGVTIVVSPLVALMADQALELNRAIGGAVRALVTPLRESSSRAGRQEVAEQLTGVAEHHIKLVYCSPERFAHRQFRDWVRAGIAAGRVNRIVFDEAHTLVSWGDDFRPSYRRLAVALADLRGAGGGRQPVSALTATANKAVREGLRTGLFSLAAEAGPEGDPAGFFSISANPVRPELAIYKVALTKAGPVSMSRYVESVFDTAFGLDGHAVFYCLTVREVDALYAHLCDYAGPAARSRIRRFHGRMPEAEKAAVLSDFRDAPKAGDDDFAPMVVVATSAFGLGIDRGDVRCVLVTSPPTDLAALYQQLGRAGRDSVGQIPGPGGPVNAGIALASARGFRTVEFITRDVPARVLEAAGRAVLGCGGLLDSSREAERIIDAAVKAGRLPAAVADKDATKDSYRTAVMRAVAALADLGAVDDLGDMPATLRLTPGETPAPTGSDSADRFAAAARAWVEADPARAKKASVVEVHRHLVTLGLVDVGDPAATWADLVECHHAGVLDVSAAPNRTWLTTLTVKASALPAEYARRVAARAKRAADELSELRGFFAEHRSCANQMIADYFAPAPPGALPAGTCSTPECRCINHWAGGASGSPPGLLNAVLNPPVRPASAGDDKRRRARLDADIARLLRECFYGLGPRTIWMTLRGNDTYFDRASGTRRPLRAQLLYHRLFGSRPAVRYAAVTDAIDRLCAAGDIVADGYRWRHAQN